MEKRRLKLKTTTLIEKSETDSSCDSEAKTLNMLTRRFNKFLRRKEKRRINKLKGIPRKLIQILLTLLALDVESRGISRWNVEI